MLQEVLSTVRSYNARKKMDGHALWAPEDEYMELGFCSSTEMAGC
jgi:hypothetical protein